MNEMTVREEPRRTWYTFELKEKDYVLTKAEWINGKMIIHGVSKDGQVIAIEMQYGVFFTGSTDSIDGWLAGKER